MTYGSLFSGIGGFDRGLDAAGMSCSWQVEKDKYATLILEKHWPETKRSTDVRNVKRRSVRKPDLICGGFPCQDVSVAGRRAGLAGSRSGLFWETHRIISAFLPKWFLLENVPGLFSSGEGRDFGLVIASLADLGYGVAWRVLDSQYFGLAQRRERVFIVGSLGSLRSGEVLFEPESVSRDTPPSREAGTDIARCFVVMGGPDDNAAQAGHLVASTLTSRHTPNGHGGAGTRLEDIPNLVIAQTLIANNGGNQIESNYVVETLTANWARSNGAKAGNNAGMVNPVINRQGVRRLTPRECERLQGFPDDFTRYGADGKEISDSQRYRMLGNAVSAPVSAWIGRRIMEASE